MARRGRQQRQEGVEVDAVHCRRTRRTRRQPARFSPPAQPLPGPQGSTSAGNKARLGVCTCVLCRHKLPRHAAVSQVKHTHYSVLAACTAGSQQPANQHQSSMSRARCLPVADAAGTAASGKRSSLWQAAIRPRFCAR